LMSECFIVRAMYERSSTVGSRKYIVCISSRLLHNMAYEMIKQTVSLSLNFQVCYITTPHLFVAHLLTYLRSLRELSTYYFPSTKTPSTLSLLSNSLSFTKKPGTRVQSSHTKRSCLLGS
jgi:hypothetical protein